MPPSDKRGPGVTSSPSEYIRAPGDTAPAKVQVRRMGAGDLDAVMAIAAESPEASVWSRESYAKCLDPRYGIALVAEEVLGEKSTITGFLVGRVAGAEAEILNLAIAANSRRRRHGTALLEAAIEAFTDSAAEWVFLEVRESNAAAIAFYEKRLFARNGLRKGYYRNPDEAAVIMMKWLES